LLAAESILVDRRNPQGAIAALAAIAPPAGNRQLIVRKAGLQADAFEAIGQRDAAVAVLEAVLASGPPNARLQARVEALKQPAVR
jgi:hypothetical protein